MTIQPGRAVLVACVAMAACGQAVWAEQAKPSKKIAVFQLRGPLVETPRGMAFLLIDEPRGTLRSVLKRFDRAAKDKNVAGVALLMDQPVFGWAQAQEIRAGIDRIRKSGRDVFCHIASPYAGGYLVASACSRVYMVPSGTLGLSGVSAEAMYFKGTLDKLGIVADLEHCGAYKGSGEPFTRTGPSKRSQEQMRRLLGDLYDQMVTTIAASRGLRPEDVRAVIDAGPLTASRAAAAKLVDELKYRHEFISDVRRRCEGAEMAMGYGREKGPTVDFASPFGLFQMFKDLMGPKVKRGKGVIALVPVDGMIVDGKSAETIFGETIVGGMTLRNALTKAARDKDVKAVVLRINSPGGSALASDIIHQATQLVRKSGKPLIASMGDMAASGGYYVAAGADAIFADPGTLTGSIGVIGGKLALGGLFDKIGVTTHTYKFGQNADLFNVTRSFDDREREVVRGLMTACYGRFKQVVVDGRGDRLKGDIEDLAGGRIYTGRQAREKGLVDTLGGLDDAVRLAAEKANLTDYQIRVMPRPKTLFDYFREALGLEDEGVRIGVEAGLVRRLGSAGDGADVLPLLGRLAPDCARAAGRMLWRVELLRRESVLTVMPQELVIR